MKKFTFLTKKILQFKAFVVLTFCSILLLNFNLKAQTANCGEIVALTTSNFPGTTVTQGKDGLCALCGVSNEANVINGNTEDYANIAFNLSVGGSAWITVKSPVVFPGGSTAGMSFNPQSGFLNVVGLSILGNVTVSTLLNGQEQESETGDQLISGDIINFFDNKNSIGFTTNLPFNEIRITIKQGVALLSNPQVFHAFVKTGCFNYQSCPSAASVTEGVFKANGTAGQNGTISIPITGATEGPVNVTISGGGFSVNPDPRKVDITAGQTHLEVPVIFNGSGSPGQRTVNISVTTSAGVKQCTVTIPVTANSVLDVTNDPLSLNLGYQNEYTGNAYNEIVPFGGVEITANGGKYNYYAVNCVSEAMTGGTVSSTTNVLTSISGVNPVTGASYATNLYPNVNGTVVMNRTTGAYTYTKDNAYSGTTAKFCVKICDLDLISPCKQVEVNLTNVGAAVAPNAPTTSSNPSPLVTGQSATLSASGCAGTVNWFNNGSPAGTGTTLSVPSVPANASYTATCTVNGATSTNSQPITSGAGAVNAPSISSSPNPPVAGQSATFSASGCAGTVTWFNNGSQVGTGPSFTTTAVAGGNYTATCTVNGVQSNPSSPIAVSQPAVADLAVAFTVNPGNVFTSGQSRSYTITVRNLSTTTASQPTTLTISSSISGFNVSGGGSQSVGSLAPNASQTYNVTVTGNNKGASGALNALLSGSADNNSSNNSASTRVSVQNP